MLGQQIGILVVKVRYFMDSRVTWTYKKIKRVYVQTLLDFRPLHWAYDPCDGNGLIQTFSIIVNKWNFFFSSFHSFSTFFCPKVSSRSFALKDLHHAFSAFHVCFSVFKVFYSCICHNVCVSNIARGLQCFLLDFAKMFFMIFCDVYTIQCNLIVCNFVQVFTMIFLCAYHFVLL